jgi:23S rRNA G2445 N2-methylase RlmL
MNYIAFVTKGIESICAEELKLLTGLKILSVNQKFIEFEFDGNPTDLRTIRTVDDIGILVGRVDFQKILDKDLENELKFIKEEAIVKIKELRELNDTFSITVSIYKNNAFTQDKLKSFLADYLSTNLDLKYTPLEHSNLDIRVNIEEQDCLITLKLFQESLFRREYGHKSDFGSFKSSIVAAMIFKLAKGRKDLKIVDNFCGSGTFLCEGFIQGLEVFGGDIDKNSVKLTIENLNKIKKDKWEVYELDATACRWGNNQFDIAVSNLPWNKQIKLEKLNKLYLGSVKELARILKEDGGLGLVCVRSDIIRKHLERYLPTWKIEEFKLGYLGQTPSIVFAYKEK